MAISIETRTAVPMPTNLVRVGAETEMPDRLAVALRATEEDDVGASWGTHSELVESQALAAGLLNASTSRRGEAQGADAHLGDLEETVVIGDRGHNGSDLALVSLG